jgi:drug/metabolite transporter (DMT)-like permease
MKPKATSQGKWTIAGVVLSVVGLVLQGLSDSDRRSPSDRGILVIGGVLCLVGCIMLVYTIAVSLRRS